MHPAHCPPLTPSFTLWINSLSLCAFGLHPAGPRHPRLPIDTKSFFQACPVPLYQNITKPHWIRCVPHPGRLGQSLHSNIGPLCQFHTSCEDDEPYIKKEGAQVWRGSMTLAYSSDDSFQKALTRLDRIIASPPVQGTKASLTRQPGGGSATLSCPYGNRFILRPASGEELQGLGEQVGVRPGSEGSAVLGITSISLPCRPGTAEGICDFYRRVFGFEAAAKGGRGVVRATGGRQTMEFVEQEGELPAYTGDHFCIYISDFKR